MPLKKIKGNVTEEASDDDSEGYNDIVMDVDEGHSSSSSAATLSSMNSSDLAALENLVETEGEEMDMDPPALVSLMDTAMENDANEDEDEHVPDLVGPMEADVESIRSEQGNRHIPDLAGPVQADEQSNGSGDEGQTSAAIDKEASPSRETTRWNKEGLPTMIDGDKFKYAKFGVMARPPRPRKRPPQPKATILRVTNSSGAIYTKTLKRTPRGDLYGFSDAGYASFLKELESEISFDSARHYLVFPCEGMQVPVDDAGDMVGILATLTTLDRPDRNYMDFRVVDKADA